MGQAKQIQLAPIERTAADGLVKRVHYSGKVVNNSQLHLGVFLAGVLEGVLQFGPSIDKSKLVGLVADTPWNGFIELNRMAFTDRLPRNSESRALAVAMRLLRRHYPHLQWVVSFADACQCGDGTIYRASGFVLTDIRKNDALWQLPDGRVTHKLNLEAARANGEYAKMKGADMSMGSATYLRSIGAKKVEGHQLRYVYFLDRTARARLTVPEVSFAEIEAQGVGMYRGEKVSRTAGAAV